MKPIMSVAAAVVIALAAVNCAKASSPTIPTTTAVLAGIELNPATAAAGGSAQGTVALAATVSGVTSISLSSSDSTVATVQNTVTVQAGASTAAFTIAAGRAGTATITASLNGSTPQSAVLTVTPGAALSAITLSSSSVVGGGSVNATVILTAPAPQNGGAVVSLSGTDPVTVPASVTVPAGSMSATFTILTREVGDTVAVPVGASYGGASASIVLSVTRSTVARAGFGVTGSSGTETCTLENNGSTLNCTFNGSTSRAPGTIIAWDWSWSVAGMFAQTTSGPVLTNPSIDCSLVPPPPLPPGNPGWYSMTVTLKIHDDLGNVSSEAVNTGVRLIPRDSCGY